MLLSQFLLMADYNQWMNTRLYDAAAKLSAAELERDRGAFFGSILGTLNHLAVTDIMWLQRFSAHPSNHRSLDPVRARRHVRVGRVGISDGDVGTPRQQQVGQPATR